MLPGGLCGVVRAEQPRREAGGVGVVRHALDQGVQRARFRDGVRVQEEDQVAAGLRGAAVHRRSESQVAAGPQHADVRPAGRQLARVAVRTVVDDDQLEARVPGPVPYQHGEVFLVVPVRRYRGEDRPHTGKERG